MGGCCRPKIVKYRKRTRCRVTYKTLKYNDSGICSEISKNFLEDVDIIEHSMSRKKRNLLKETKVNQILDPAALSVEVSDL